MPAHLDTDFFFFFNDTATTEIYTLSLHDALPISLANSSVSASLGSCVCSMWTLDAPRFFHSASTVSSLYSWMLPSDRKSTRLNSSHLVISYAVFCLKKKNKELRSSTVTT